MVKFDFLKTFDVLGNTPSLYANEEKRYSSVCGGIFSIILSVIVLAFLILLTYQTFNNKNILISYYSTYNSHPKTLNYYDDLQLAFGIETKNKELILDKSIFNVNAYLRVNNSATQSIYLKLERCTDRGEFNNLEFNRTNLLCISNYTDNPEIRSNLLNLDPKNLLLKFNLCSNSTSESICASQEDIENVLDNSYLKILFQTNKINFENSTNPINKIIIERNSELSISKHLSLSLNVKEVDIIKQNSEIFSDLISTSTFVYDYILNEETSIKDGNFLTLKFNIAETKDIYILTFPKFIVFLSNVGGLTYFIFIICNLLFYFYRNNLETFYLLNTIFYLKSSEEEYSQHVVNSENLKIFNQISQNLNQLRNNVNGINANPTIPNLNIKRKRKKLNYSCLTRIYFCIRTNMNKPKQNIIRAIKIFERTLDIGNIFKMQFNIEKIKYLICNKEQIVALEYLDKIELSRLDTKQEEAVKEDVNNFYDNLLNHDDNPDKSTENVARAIFHVKIAESEIDKKITELIE